MPETAAQDEEFTSLLNRIFEEHNEVIQAMALLGVRYSTSCLAISANRLEIRPLAKARDGRREAAPTCFVDEGVVLLSDLR